MLGGTRAYIPFSLAGTLPYCRSGPMRLLLTNLLHSVRRWSSVFAWIGLCASVSSTDSHPIFYDQLLSQPGHKPVNWTVLDYVTKTIAPAFRIVRPVLRLTDNSGFLDRRVIQPDRPQTVSIACLACLVLGNRFGR
jgi:hypothetical protein